MGTEGGFIAEMQPAGNYSKQFNLKAEPDPDCDPTQGPCEQWLPGNYTVKICKYDTLWFINSHKSKIVETGICPILP